MSDGVLEVVAAVLTLVAAIIGYRAAKGRHSQPPVLGSSELGDILSFVGTFAAIMSIPLVIWLFMVGGRILLREFKEAGYRSDEVTPLDAAMAKQESLASREDSIRAAWSSREPELSAMLDAAELMPHWERRDTAFAEIAWLSARRGNGYFMRKAAEAIGRESYRAKVLNSALFLLTQRSESLAVARGRIVPETVPHEVAKPSR
jgi:hypothetical protein